MAHMRIDFDYYRTPEFIKFSKLARSTVLFFLISAVVRDSEEVRHPSHGGHWTYKNHFLKGRLVGRYSQKNIAKYLETSQQSVSKELKKLEEEGFIRKIEVITNNCKVLYYQVGTWSGELGGATYKENLFFDMIFRGYAEAAKAKREDERNDFDISTLEHKKENLNPDDVFYEDDMRFYTEQIERLRRLAEEVRG